MLSNEDRVRSAFSPDSEDIKRALSVAFKEGVVNNNPTTVQAAGNVNVEGDSILVFSLMYERPSDKFDECSMLYGFDGLFSENVGHFTYRVRDEHVSPGWMIPK